MTELCSYRTYEEWKLTKFFSAKGGDKVLTVPMRNGNDNKETEAKETVQGSYRTYEEWKLSTHTLRTDFFRYVFLPYL